MSYFPFFIDISDKNGLIVGGGMVAYRKVAALSEFGAKLKIVADYSCNEIKEFVSCNTHVQLILRKFKETDLDDIDFCIAATDDSKLNQSISKLCNARHILVNVVDEKALCGFIFPSYVKKNEVVIGISSGGNSPLISQEIRKSIEESLPEDIGACANFLGELREAVKSSVQGEMHRKACYKELLKCYMKSGERPDEDTIMEMISRYSFYNK